MSTEKMSATGGKIKTTLFRSILAFIFVAGFLLTMGVQKVSADSCSGAGETCMPTTIDNSTTPPTYIQPTGFFCTFRGTCSGGPSIACCAPVAASTTAPAAPGAPTSFTNPLKYTTVDQFLSAIMGALQAVIVSLALVMIVLGAVLYVTSGGGKQMETAKGMITAALVGLAIGIAAPSFLKQIAGILNWGTQDTRLAAALSLSQIAINVLNFLLGIVGVLSLIMLVVGASMYLTSAGDEKRVETGKNIFKSALIGVFIAMVSMVLVTQIARFFVVGPSAAPACSANNIGQLCNFSGAITNMNGTCSSAGTCMQSQ